MTGYLTHLRSLLPEFRRREDGTATVEAVLWLPIFLAVFGLMVDSAVIFNGQSKVLRIVQDANRNLSIGRLENDAEVVTYINNELAAIGITPSSTTAVSDMVAGIVTTEVRVPASELQLLGYFSVLTNLQLPVRAQHMREDWTV